MHALLLTGGTGFVGGALLDRLLSDCRYSPVVAVRRQICSFRSGLKTMEVGDISGVTNWQNALAGVKVVVHAAARAHVLSEESSDPLYEFRRVNVEGTLSLARQAVDSGVERFIFLSSIGVNGNITARPFTEDDIPDPKESYAISKYEAELGLRELSKETGMQLVIIRPPLVYGPNAPGNFNRLIRAVDSGVPLPLGCINNQRSLVALDNLVDLIVTCIDHPAAANQTFLVSDGEDLSTTELLRRMATALGKPARLLPVPSWLLEAGASMLGKKALSQRLCGSLQVDISKTRELLGWTPPLSVDAALRKTAAHFLEHRTH